MAATAPAPDNEDAIKLYELLHRDEQNLHGRWLDNWRVALTASAIIFGAATFGLKVIVDCYSGCAEVMVAGLVLVVVLLSITGLLVIYSTIQVISRIGSVIELRHNELRALERDHLSRLPLQPFTEGYYLTRGKSEELLNLRANSMDSVSAVRHTGFRARQAYRYTGYAISTAFCTVLVAAIAAGVLA